MLHSEDSVQHDPHTHPVILSVVRGPESGEGEESQRPRPQEQQLQEWQSALLDYLARLRLTVHKQSTQISRVEQGIPCLSSTPPTAN